MLASDSRKGGGVALDPLARVLPVRIQPFDQRPEARRVVQFDQVRHLVRDHVIRELRIEVHEALARTLVSAPTREEALCQALRLQAGLGPMGDTRSSERESYAEVAG